ncbi:MAG: MarR family transcriptional regulator [Candidatus Bathyarchaeota archaeon]|nr:MarR family transcriptional regulator [Candidatus Bathyarchaeota archaeon]
MELVFTTFALFMVTLAASYIFYQRIKMAQSEYEDSKDSVRNITFGFLRQVRKIEMDLSRVEIDASQAKYLASEALKSNQGNADATLQGLEKVKELNDRVENIEGNIEQMRVELKKLATQPRAVLPVSSPVDAPIPVQGDDIFQQLTSTEIEVLQMIVEFGEGTVPEIKAQINKTREHTARLLKKLYDKGFVDRNTNRMPYRYVIRKEIKDLILERKEQTPLGL